MTAMPREPVLDATAQLMRDPYCYTANRCRRVSSDAFQTGLLLRPTIFSSYSEVESW